MAALGMSAATMIAEIRCIKISSVNGHALTAISSVAT